MNEIRIATRGSALALWQAEHIRDRLVAIDPALRVSLVVLKTQGDRIIDRPLSQVGGKGLFTKEIEEALLDGRADLAVHSMKDLPAEIPEGLLLAAVPRREDPRDALILPPFAAQSTAVTVVEQLARLPQGARVGTSSLRRVCQLRALRPDLTILPLRGNVDTRLRKLDAGEFDAVILASAGLIRLGHGARISYRFGVDEMVPAAGQGALGLECRADDRALQERLQPLVDADATTAIFAERAFIARLYGNCQTPLGAHATIDHRRGAPLMSLRAIIGSVDGKTVLRDFVSGRPEDAVQLGRKIAEKLLAAGGEALMAPSESPAAAAESGQSGG